MKLNPDHILAFAIFVVCALLLAFKIDGEVKTLMASCVGYIIGSGVQARKSK